MMFISLTFFDKTAVASCYVVFCFNFSHIKKMITTSWFAKINDEQSICSTINNIIISKKIPMITPLMVHAHGYLQRRC